jgi:hypothetical protein
MANIFVDSAVMRLFSGPGKETAAQFRSVSFLATGAGVTALGYAGSELFNWNCGNGRKKELGKLCRKQC